jgi:hypothetical protein
MTAVLFLMSIMLAIEELAVTLALSNTRDSAVEFSARCR